MFPTGTPVKTQTAERTVTSFVCMKLLATWILGHESARGFYHFMAPVLHQSQRGIPIALVPKDGEYLAEGSADFIGDKRLPVNGAGGES